MPRHIAIIGAGVIGLSIARACAEKGYRVTIVEANGPRRDGCSFGNMGMVVPSHFVPLAAPGMVALGLKWMWNPESPFYIKPRLSWDLLSWAVRFWQSSTAAHVSAAAPVLRDLHLLSRFIFEQMAATGKDVSLVKKGLLMLCKTEHGWDEESRAAATAKELGILAEILTLEELKMIEPGVSSRLAGAVHYPLDCHLTPESYMSRLQAELEMNPRVHFIWNSPVTGWKTSGGKIEAAIMDGKVLEADEFILSAGVWSQGAAKDLRLSLPMQAGKGYSLTLASPPQQLNLCAILAEARVAVTPMGSSLRVGGTMEMSGINHEQRTKKDTGNS